MRFLSAAILATMLTAPLASAQDHEERYCTALSSLRTDLQQLRALRDEANVRELRTVIDRIDKDSRDVEQQGEKIQTQAGKQFMAAAERLKVEGRAVSDDMTIAQVKTRMREDLGNLELSARQLAHESGCPHAMPQRGSEATPPARGPGRM